MGHWAKLLAVSPSVSCPCQALQHWCGGAQGGLGVGWGSVGWVFLQGCGALACAWLGLRLPQVHQDQGEAI